MRRVYAGIFGVLLMTVLVLLAITIYSITGEAEAEWRGAVIDPPLPLQDFTLAATDGSDFSLSEHPDDILLIYFGYMTCPDFCPDTLNKLQRVYGELEAEEAERVRVLFVTVDPERDTLERLARYVAAFDENFIGLRSEDDQALFDLMSQFGVVAQRVEVDSVLGYLVDHTVTLYMVDGVAGLMNRFDSEAPYDDILHDLRLALKG